MRTRLRYPYPCDTSTPGPVPDCKKTAPLGQNGRAVRFEVLSAVERAFLIEVVTQLPSRRIRITADCHLWLFATRAANRSCRLSHVFNQDTNASRHRAPRRIYKGCQFRCGFMGFEEPDKRAGLQSVRDGKHRHMTNSCACLGHGGKMVHVFGRASHLRIDLIFFRSAPEQP